MNGRWESGRHGGGGVLAEQMYESTFLRIISTKFDYYSTWICFQSESS